MSTWMMVILIIGCGFGFGMLIKVAKNLRKPKILTLTANDRQNVIGLDFPIPFDIAVRGIEDGNVWVVVVLKKPCYTRFFGLLKKGVMKNGTWGYKEFTLGYIDNSKKGKDDKRVCLHVGTDLFEIREQMIFLKKFWDDKGIPFILASRFKDDWDDIEKDINNISYLARKWKEKKHE